MAIRSHRIRYMLIIGFIAIIIIIISLILVIGQSKDEKRLISSLDAAWAYTNGKWEQSEEAGWGTVMTSMYTGARAHIETNSPYAILKKRGNGDGIYISVDGIETYTGKVPRDGEEYELPIYQDNEGWHHIEIATDNTNEIDGLYISSKAEIRKPVDDRKRLVVIGHSYAAGCCIANSGIKSFASLLGDMLGVESINEGVGKTDIQVGGNRSGLGRVQSAVIDWKPDYVLSVYGYNGRRSDPVVYQENYSEFLQQIVQSLPETHIFASGIISLRGLTDKALEPINLAIKNACSSASNCTYIDLSGKWNDDNYSKYVSGDGIHPSEAGYQFLAEEYGKVISTVMNR